MSTITFNNQQFTAITNAPNYYICRDTAEVLLFTHKGRLLKTHIVNNNARVGIRISGRRTTRTVYNLMITQFLPTISYSKVTHKDGNVRNNTLENLIIAVTTKNMQTLDTSTDKEELLDNDKLLDKMTEDFLDELEDKFTAMHGDTATKQIIAREETLKTFNFLTEADKSIFGISQKLLWTALLTVIATATIFIIHKGI